MDTRLAKLKNADRAKAPFHNALKVAGDKLRKYFPLLPWLKQARVFDPRQREVLETEKDMGKSIETYHRVFRTSDQCAELAAEWSAYWKLPVVDKVDGFKIWSWWVAIAPTLPCMAAIARGVLAVPATGCDVERCFSSLKWVKKERQHGMSEKTHATAALLHFNGIVPNPTPA